MSERERGVAFLFQGYFIENNPISINGAHAVTASEPKKLSVEDLRPGDKS